GSAATSATSATAAMPSPTSRRRTGSSPTTGPTSARPGASSAPISARPPSTTPTGRPRSNGPAWMPTTRPSTCERRSGHRHGDLHPGGVVTGLVTGDLRRPRLVEHVGQMPGAPGLDGDGVGLAHVASAHGPITALAHPLLVCRLR